MLLKGFLIKNFMHIACRISCNRLPGYGISISLNFVVRHVCVYSLSLLDVYISVYWRSLETVKLTLNLCALVQKLYWRMKIFLKYGNISRDHVDFKKCCLSPSARSVLYSNWTYVVWSSKSVWSRSNSVFICLTNCMHQFYSYILQKTKLKLVNWFQRYEQLKDTKNKRKRKTFSAFAWLYRKINISDFRLILLEHITYSHYKRNTMNRGSSFFWLSIKHKYDLRCVM